MAVVVIHRQALVHNLEVIQKLAPKASLMAMCKANAYGHGIKHIAPLLPDDVRIAVATYEEAMELLSCRPQAKVVLTCGLENKKILMALSAYDVEFVIYSPSQMAFLKDLPIGTSLSVWLKVETGMHRLGLSCQQASDCYEILKAMPQVKHIHWMTHLACANEQEHDFVAQQVALFDHLISDKPGLKSLVNSAGLISAYPAYDVVRCGIMLFGINPLSLPLPLKNVMTFKAPIVQIKTISKGDRVGYGGCYKAQTKRVIAVVRAGYADGFPQQASKEVKLWVKGQLVPLCGRVSMDLLTIDITSVPSLVVGDMVTLWGQNHPIQQVAKALGVSAYALVTGVSARVKRSYDDFALESVLDTTSHSGCRE